MKRKLFIACLLIAAAGLIYGLASGRLSSSSLSGDGKLKVTASFYPMGEFARQVGGDKADVTVLIRPGVEPHDYDPTPQDIVAVHRSKLLVYNGAGLEPWADKLAGELRQQGTTVVQASAGFAGSDPHVWLDPVLAAREVEAVKAGFIRADPANQAYYEANATAYERQLADLDAAYRTGLAQCSRHAIVTTHQAFAYLAQRYGFEALGIAGLSPDDEPSPQKLSEVAQFVRANNVKYIFFETLASPKLAQTIAQETGVQTLVFNPLEGLTSTEQAQGQNYVTVQRENLENLKRALDCK